MIPNKILFISKGEGKLKLSEVLFISLEIMTDVIKTCAILIVITVAARRTPMLVACLMPVIR